MKLILDPESPVPLYHQIAEAVRYRIATGALAPGALLPPLREAAAGWGVNMHTVRRAYAELVRATLVESRPHSGTRVLGGARAPVANAGAVAEFAARMLREASDQHGIGSDQLVAALRSIETGRSGGVVHVVECSETQSEDLARQISAQWRVDARPWSLEQPDEPAPGAVVATYFHYNDIRCRWPARLASVRFVAIRPDPAIAKRLAAWPGGAPVTATLCELEPTMATNIEADLTAVLPARTVRIVRKVVVDPGRLLAKREGGPVLFSPRVWGELNPAQRAHPRAVEVRYVFDAAELTRVGADLGWAPR